MAAHCMVRQVASPASALKSGEPMSTQLQSFSGHWPVHASSDALQVSQQALSPSAQLAVHESYAVSQLVAHFGQPAKQFWAAE
jgi:hypothetical protein